MEPVPLPTSYAFDRLAATTSTRRLTAFIKADIRRRLQWRRQLEKLQIANCKSQMNQPDAARPAAT